MTTPALPPAGDLLTVTATGDATRCRLHAAGEIDTSSAARLAAVDAALLNGVRQLLLDLTGVTFLGAAGVRVLAGAQRHADDAGMRLRTRVGHPAVRLPLEASGVWQLLDADWTPVRAQA